MSAATSAFLFQKVAVTTMQREPDQASIQAIADYVEVAVLTYLEREIGHRTTVLDRQFSIADIAICCQLIQRL